jgi:P-type Cu2+ transporter
VVVSAVAVFLAWLPVSSERALWAAIAVLVVTCPCALGLAAPIALSACTAQLLARGVVLSRGHAIQVLAGATDVVLDKTGTLTLGKPRLVDVAVLGALARADCVRIAHALEATSRHPIAAAFEAADRLPPLASSDIVHVPGRGIEARVDGRLVRIGNEGFCAELAGSRQHSGDPVYLAEKSGWLAGFQLEDSLREHASDFVASLRRAGIGVHLVSGDREEAVAALARKLEIADYRGHAEPQHKVAYVEELQRAGRVVVMIGDGLNDAPVLAHANASIAMGSGAGVSQLHSDLVLLGSRLGTALDAFTLARRTMRVIRQNFAWAIAYNGIALPAAALGWIGPWEAAIGMAASSLIVALNSLRLGSLRIADSGSWKASPFSFRSPSRSYS